MLNFVLSLVFFAVLKTAFSLKAFSPRAYRLLLYAAFIQSLIPWGALPLGAFFVSSAVPADILEGSAAGASTLSALNYGFKAAAFGDGAGFAGVVVGCLSVVITFAGLVRNGRRIARAEIVKDQRISSEIARQSRILGLHTAVSALRSALMRDAFVWYQKQWRIVLPDVFFSMSEREQNIVIAHELIHIKRGDYWKFLALGLISSFLLLSPGMRLLKDEICHLEELETDRRALVSFDFNAVDFCEALLSFVKSGHTSAYRLPAMAAGGKGRLVERFHEIGRAGSGRTSTAMQKLFSAAAVVFMLCAAFPAAASGDTELINPLPGARLTLPFGPVQHPVSGKNYNHRGIDLAAPMGSVIAAAESGLVADCGFDDKRGNYVLINHAKGTATLYAHMSKVFVKKGDHLHRGQKIALVGSSGISTGPHLHFEVWKNGRAENPLDYIGDIGR